MVVWLSPSYTSPLSHRFRSNTGLCLTIRPCDYPVGPVRARSNSREREVGIRRNCGGHSQWKGPENEVQRAIVAVHVN